MPIRMGAKSPAALELVTRQQGASDASELHLFAADAWETYIDYSAPQSPCLNLSSFVT
jgi:hypothetical protein